ncbi:MAG: GGDEF domain-containing protein [Candidatus Accumulibacter sp.]|nr:GGDEF domain-containing protein [Accumulibacter sp.]
MSKKLLKHVEAITSHRDTALLDKSVVSSLRELLQIEEIRLYDVAHRGDDALIAMTTWSDATGIHCRHDGLHDDDYEPVLNHPGIAACIDANDKVPGDAAADARHQLLMICVDRKPIACCEITYPDTPSPQQRDLAEGILGLYRNYLSLLEDSQIDTLTGLSNRKTFERSLARLLVDEGVRDNGRENERRGSGGSGEENWLAIIDIDHFKRINDHFGHLYGDEVLILIANLMRRAFRQHDKLFRFGGEEFVVLLRGVSYENALGTLERFRQKVAEHIFPQVDQITASVGFAVIHPQDTPNAVLGHADEALYFAKDNGRNQVFCYEKLIECGKLPKKMLHTEADFF